MVMKQSSPIPTQLPFQSHNSSTQIFSWSPMAPLSSCTIGVALPPTKQGKHPLPALFALSLSRCALHRIITILSRENQNHNKDNNKNTLPGIARIAPKGFIAGAVADFDWALKPSSRLLEGNQWRFQRKAQQQTWTCPTSTGNFKARPDLVTLASGQLGPRRTEVWENCWCLRTCKCLQTAECKAKKWQRMETRGKARIQINGQPCRSQTKTQPGKPTPGADNRAKHRAMGQCSILFPLDSWQDGVPRRISQRHDPPLGLSLAFTEDPQMLWPRTSFQRFPITVTEKTLIFMGRNENLYQHC
nr:uncharacterized protein LOC105487427 [Macaca nemestrina]